MDQTVTTRKDAPVAVERLPLAGHVASLVPDLAPGAAPEISLAVYDDLSAVEQDWRAFEPQADCTVFQSFDWLATWQKFIGVHYGVTPAVVAGRDAAGAIQCIFPFATRAAGFARELAWLGTDLCDYNVPLLAHDFSQQFDRAAFMSLWGRMMQALQNYGQGFDYINLTKMPEKVGVQPNPMQYLHPVMNANGAYLTHLTGDWEAFYTAKRSSTTRRRDRTKRKRLGEFGEVKFVNAETDSDILATLDTLMKQKARLFAHMGVGNLFAKPGHADFYRAMATGATTRHLIHISKLNVGTTAAAANVGLTFRDCYYHLLASYDDGDVSRFGPGAAHLHDLLHLAIDRGFRMFDFTIGDERYKRDWCDTELKLYDIISTATWRGTLVATSMIAAQWLKRQIKQVPVLWAVFSKARALIGSLRR